MGLLEAAAGNRSGLYVVPLIAFALIAAEYLIGRYRHAEIYDAGETWASLVIAIGHRLTAAASAGIIAIPMSWVYAIRLFDIPLDNAWSLLALFLGVEFCYYGQHFAMHRVNWFWASHGVHHSATKLNLSAGVRLGWGSNISGTFLFFLPLIWLGFPPLAVLGTLGLGLLYQFFLHMAPTPRFGWLEWVLNTPAHHHVHHASNEACLDKNFGSVLIIFDRLFGTFAEAPQDKPLRYGVKGDGQPTRRPFKVVFAGWLDMIAAFRAATGWGARLSVLFGRP